MIRTPSTLEIVWGIYLLLVVIILFRPIVPILGESQFPMPLFVQSEPISPFVRHCMGVGLYEEVPALGFTSTTRAQPIWCSTKCHSACIYPCPPPTPRARSEIMRGLHPAIAPRGENTVQLAHMSCMYRAVHQIFYIHYSATACLP